MDFEVHLSLDGETQRIGSARSNRVRGKETVLLNTGASSQEIHRMASAFEHDALIQALALR